MLNPRRKKGPEMASPAKPKPKQDFLARMGRAIEQRVDEMSDSELREFQTKRKKIMAAARARQRTREKA